MFASAWNDAQIIVSTLKPGAFDDTITKAGQEDEAKQFCGPSLTWQQLCEVGGPLRLIKRFCIELPSGKLRVIDDAVAGGQSRLSQDGSKLDLCSAVQPGLNARLLWEAKLLYTLMMLLSWTGSLAEVERRQRCCASQKR